MLDLHAIGAALASSGDPKEIFDELDNEELGELRDDTENPELIRAIDKELRERTAASKGSWTGAIVWLVVIAMLAGLVAVAVFGQS